MKVILSHQQGTNAVIQSAINKALESKISLNLCFGNVVFLVDDFPAFLRCMWSGFASASRLSVPIVMGITYTLSVVVDDGTIYNVWLRYDDKAGGLRYGSIHNIPE